MVRQQDNKHKHFWLFTLSVLLIYPLPQIAIDIYLPSWPAMVHELQASRRFLQLSLTSYVFFLGIAQLIYGPLSDRFGRKPVLLVGIAVFFISSVACIFAHSITQLLVLRALQGLGIGCGFTVASAILADVFTGKQLAKITSYSSMVYSLSLVLAPILGGYLQYFIGWRANFSAMAFYSILLFFLIYFFVEETKDRKKIIPLSFSFITKNYFLLFRNFQFISAVMCLILSYGVMIAFNIVGPFLLQETLGVTVVHYSYLLLLIGLSYFLGATTNSYALKYFSTHFLTIAGLLLMALSAFCLFIISVMFGIGTVSIIMFVSLSFFSLGFVYPNCFAYALEIFPEKGYVSAFVGSAILIGVSLISIFVQYNMSYQLCLSITLLILAVLSILSYLLMQFVKGEYNERR